MTDDEMHWMSPIGATHAVVNVMAFHGTDDKTKVTCPICLDHIKRDEEKS